MKTSLLLTLLTKINGTLQKTTSTLLITALSTQSVLPVITMIWLEANAAAEETAKVEGERAAVAVAIARKLENASPDITPSIADKMLSVGGNGFVNKATDMLMSFRSGVTQGASLAWDGNGTMVMIGAKNGWKFLKEYGEAAGVHYVDSVWLLPEKAVKIGGDFKQAGIRTGKYAASNWGHTEKAWSRMTKNIAADAHEFVELSGNLTQYTGEVYSDSVNAIGDGAVSGAKDFVKANAAVWNWVGDQEVDAWDGLTNGTVKKAIGTGKWTLAVGKFAVDETGNAAKSVTGWARDVWNVTGEATSATWDATKYTAEAGSQLREVAADGATWLAGNSIAPLKQAGTAISDYSSWNWRRGWTQGVVEGVKTGGEAWNHTDQFLGTVWAIKGIGAGVVHVLLLEPAVVPFIATYGVAGTVAMNAVGFPSVGLVYGAGLAGTGLAYATGAAVTGVIGVTGGVAGVIAGGTGVARTLGTGVLGGVATVGTAVGGATYTATAAGIHAARLGVTPVLGVAASAAVTGYEALSVIGISGYNVAKMAGVTAFTGAGYASIGAYEATKMVYNATRFAGTAVFDNAILTPVGVVTNLAQALATGTWRLAEDPVKGTLNLMAAGGVVVGTIATSLGGFSYELTKGILFGVGNGIAAVAYAGLWVVGVPVKAGEFIWSMLNVPQHRKWAKFRRDEVAEILEGIKRNSESAFANRLGEVIIIRTSWFGDDKGKVRFFLTKNRTTGERWFFKRSVNPKTCEVSYLVTNQDPIVRKFSHNPWLAAFQTDLFVDECLRAR